jgi:enoyl-CoA hydratase/carnithine racemase
VRRRRLKEARYLSGSDQEFVNAEVVGKVVTAVVANPPMNLITGQVLEELDRLTLEVESDPDLLVLVLKSRTPGFFICHARYQDFDKLKTARVPISRDDVGLNAVHRICERLRTMDKVSIAQVEGRATGGGAAIAMACNLRYGAVGRAVFNSFGVPIGTGIGGGATQYMPRLVGPSRAMELILGGRDLDAVTAEQWGYVTRALPAQEIDGFVDDLARRLAACAPAAVRQTKRLIANALEMPIPEGLREENFHMQQLALRDDAVTGIRNFLELGGETIAGESRLADLLGEVLDKSER